MSIFVSGVVESPSNTAPIMPIVESHCNPQILPNKGGEVVLAMDSEWVGNGHGGWLVTAVSVIQPMGEVNFLFWHPKALEIQPREVLARVSRDARACPVFDFTTPWEYLETLMGEGVKRIETRLFYSPKDLRMFWGDGAFCRAVKAGLLGQKRRLTLGAGSMVPGAILGSDGRWYKSKRHCKAKTGNAGYRKVLDDLRGNSSGSLAAMAESLGVPMNKDILDPADGTPINKAAMDKALELNPQDFARYAIEDASKLHEIRDTFQSKTSELMGRFTDVWIEPGKLKGTNGAMVAQYFERWLLARDSRVEIALQRLGSLSLGLRGDALEESRLLRDTVERELAANPQNPRLEPGDLKAYLRLPMEDSGLDGAGSRVLGTNRDSRALAAMVQGGRAVNEAPHHYRIGRGLDTDQKSCYGSTLARFDYPLGLPSTLALSQNQQRPTLGKWLKAHKPILVPGLWMVLVSGKLSFKQDLIFSKYSSIAKIRRAVLGRELAEIGDLSQAEDIERELSKIPGDFHLTTREIGNGIITQEILDAILTVGSKAEQKEIMALRVETAVWYSEDDRCNTVGEWVERVLTSPGQKKGTKDERPRAWVAVPIGDFLGPLLNERGRLKAAMKQAKGEEKTRLNAEQTILKLFINTLYGCIASPYFSIGNVVVANNITASARLAAWQMAKALGSVQSITDGGAFPLDGVRFLGVNARRPGFNTLATYTNWKDRKKGRKIGNLGGLDWAGDAWDELINRIESGDSKGVGEWIDGMVTSHIKTFWEAYGLAFNFEIETKVENTFSALAYWNKTDYALRTIGPYESKTYVDSNGIAHEVGNLKIKVRGERFDFGDAETVAPKIELLINILAGVDVIPAKAQWIQTKLHSVTAWAKGGYEGVLPGDELVTERGLAGPIYRRSFLSPTTEKMANSLGKDKRDWAEYGEGKISGLHRAMRGSIPES